VCLEVIIKLNILLVKYFESKYNLVVLNKYNQYKKKGIISLLIFLELFFKNIGFIVRILDSNQNSSRFRLYIKRGGIVFISVCISTTNI
jgi:hypothetical protein